MKPRIEEAVARWSATFRAGRIEECKVLAQQLVKDQPDAGKAWQLLGMSCFAHGVDEASQDCPSSGIPLRDAQIRA